MKKYLYILLSLACIAGIASCEKSDDAAVPANSKDGANLTIAVDVPTFSATTRTAIATDPENSAGQWTNWDKFVDGALLYRVTIFVLDSENKLAAWRDFYSGSDDNNEDAQQKGDNGFYENSAVSTSATTGIAVKATFNASSPLHTGEQLQAGDYKVLAVANYAPINSETHKEVYDGSNTYAGLGVAAEDGASVKNGDGGNFTELVSNIISEGINYDFDETEKRYGQALLNYTLNSGDDRVCKLMPQPLVMVRDVTLTNGKTTKLDGLLSRTFARIRLEVKNNSEAIFLDISNLQFNGAYASQKAYLFNDKSKDAVKLSNDHVDFSLYDGTNGTKGALGVTSTDAIVSAAGTTDAQRVLPGNQTAIFDCYILEGQIDAEAGFTYSFTATYQQKMADGDATANCRITSFYSDTAYDPNASTEEDNKNPGDGGSQTSYGLLDESFYLFIRCSTSTNETNCLKVDINSNTIVSGDTGNAGDSFQLAPEYIWKIIVPQGEGGVTTVNQVESATGYLQSASTGLYLQPYDGISTTLQLGTQPAELIFKMNFEGSDEHGTVFCQYNGKYYYIENGQWAGPVENLTTYEILTFETVVATPVDPKTGTVEKHVEYKESESSDPTVIRKIVRNDFFYGILPISMSN